MLDDVQRAGVERALKTLEVKPDYHHPTAVIRRVAGAAAVAQIAELTADYRDANKAAKENSGAMLSAEAADYWQEAQGVLRFATLVQAGNDPDFKKEKALARKCERLEESFEARVPDYDKPKFIRFDPQSLEAQDSRWDRCVDGNFPLLDTQFAEKIAVHDPVGEAQRAVLSSLLDEREPAAQSANVSRLRTMFSEFKNEREARDRKENIALTRRVEATAKRNTAIAKRAARKAKAAAKAAAKGRKQAEDGAEGEA